MLAILIRIYFKNIYIASKDTLDLKNSWLWPGQRWRLQCPLNIVKPPFLARSLEIKRLEKLHINQLDLEWNGHYVNWCLYFIHNIFFNLTLMRRPFSRKSKDKFDIGSGTIQFFLLLLKISFLLSYINDVTNHCRKIILSLL